MANCHNILVTIHTGEKQDIESATCSIRYLLDEMKKESMKITGDIEKDSKNNFYLVKILSMIDKLKEIDNALERHDNWYNQYIEEWKKEKENKDND